MVYGYQYGGCCTWDPGQRYDGGHRGRDGEGQNFLDMVLEVSWGSTSGNRTTRHGFGTSTTYQVGTYSVNTVNYLT